MKSKYGYYAKRPIRGNRRGVEMGDEYGFPGSELTAEEIEFGRAMQIWQELHGRWPHAADVLKVAKFLGYRKVL